MLNYDFLQLIELNNEELGEEWLSNLKNNSKRISKTVKENSNSEAIIETETEPLIASIVGKLADFDRNYRLDLPLSSYEKRLRENHLDSIIEENGVTTEGMSISSGHVFNVYDVYSNYFSTSGIRRNLIEIVLRKTWGIIFDKSVSEYLLCGQKGYSKFFSGGPYNVAYNAARELFYNNESEEIFSELEQWGSAESMVLFTLEPSNALETNDERKRIEFGYFVNQIAKVYEEKFMRYRLWTQDALERLACHLFEDNQQDDDGPIIGYFNPDMDNNPLPMDRFIREVEDEILEYFPEYVPIEHMSNNAIEYLYNRYKQDIG